MSRLAVAAVAVVAVVLRLASTLHHAVDSDEPQHLHVVIEWTRGLVQYRDIFDNHAPLFHLLMAPLVTFVGERPDAVRLAPVFSCGRGSWWRAGRCSVSRATPSRGRSHGGPCCPSALSRDSCSFHPNFAPTSCGWRCGCSRWCSCWAGLSTRAFLGALFLGAAFATSLKTLLMLLALALAAADHARLRGRSATWQRPFGSRHVALAAAAGLLAVPAACAALLLALHGFSAMIRCTVTHNVVGGLGIFEQAAVAAHAVPGGARGPAVARGALDPARARCGAQPATGCVVPRHGFLPLFTRRVLAADHAPGFPCPRRRWW